MKPGMGRDLLIHKRHGMLAAAESIKDVYDGLRELVTNSDDSYLAMGKTGGPIIIEVIRRRGQPHIVRVKDRAAGMTLEEMCEKIGESGKKTSTRGARGFFARGARDVAVLGDLTYESIKEGRYHKSQLTRTWRFIPWEEEGKRGGSPVAAKADLERLGIHATGTVATWEVQTAVPYVKSLKEQLQVFWPLRDIVSEDSDSRVDIFDGNELVSERICYRRPEAELIVNEDYAVPGYDGVAAKFQLYRAPEPLKDLGERFRHTGILVKAQRAIHECNFLLAKELESDPLAARYFGRLECAYIDNLCDEFDRVVAEALEYPPPNPELLIDPQRHKGLSRSHPFTKALFDYPTTTLRRFVAEDRKALSRQTENIGNAALQRRLNQLAKAAANFLQDEAEQAEWVTDDDEVDDGLFRSGVLIVPTYANVPLSGERRLTLYVSRSLPVDQDTRFSIDVDSDAVEVSQRDIALRPHAKHEGLLLGTISLHGVRLKEAVAVTAQSNVTPRAEALVSVVPEHPARRDFAGKLEFEHKSLKIREGRRKTIRLYAQYPELVTGSTIAEVLSSSPEDLVVRGSVTLTPVDGTNYAVGDVVLEARRQVSKAVTLSARVNEASCSATAHVVQDETKGAQMEFVFVDKHLYGFRAQWGDAEGKPNLLEISARHQSVKRYLGAPPDYLGQNTAPCRLLVAEIVAEAVCRRTLASQAATRSWEFDWGRSVDNEEIADSVIRHFNKLMEKFLPIAHLVMLSETEVRSLVADAESRSETTQLSLQQGIE